MKLSTALRTLKKKGWETTGVSGSYTATKEGSTVSFFVNPGEDTTSRFTYESENSCSPTYGLSLKMATAEVNS